MILSPNDADTTELVLAGNFSGVKPEEGRYDANHGLLLQAQGGQLNVKDNASAGLHLQGDVRQVATARSVDGKKLLIVGEEQQ